MNEAALETTRLILRPRRLTDLEANLAMDLDPAVHRYIYGNTPPDRDSHRQKLRNQITQGWPPQGGLWIVERKAKRGFLGWCALVPLEQSGLIEIGYRYIAAAWEQGIATEAAKQVLDHGFRDLGLDPIVAVAHPQNTASQHVLTKIGLKRAGMAFHYGQSVVFFRLDAGEYLARPDDGPEAPR